MRWLISLKYHNLYVNYMISQMCTRIHNVKEFLQNALLSFMILEWSKWLWWVCFSTPGFWTYQHINISTMFPYWAFFHALPFLFVLASSTNFNFLFPFLSGFLWASGLKWTWLKKLSYPTPQHPWQVWRTKQKNPSVVPRVWEGQRMTTGWTKPSPRLTHRAMRGEPRCADARQTRVGDHGGGWPERCFLCSRASGGLGMTLSFVPRIVLRSLTKALLIVLFFLLFLGF